MTRLTDGLPSRVGPEPAPCIIGWYSKALHHNPRIAGRDNNITGDLVEGVHRHLKNPRLAAVIGDCSNIWGVVDADLHGDVSRLTGDITGVTGNCSNISGNVTHIRSDVSALRGDVSRLSGSCSFVSGDCSGVWGDCSHFTGDVTGISADLTWVASLNPFKSAPPSLLNGA
jgi:hypothetical protein